MFKVVGDFLLEIGEVLLDCDVVLMWAFRYQEVVKLRSPVQIMNYRQ